MGVALRPLAPPAALAGDRGAPEAPLFPTLCQALARLRAEMEAMGAVRDARVSNLRGRGRGSR